MPNATAKTAHDVSTMSGQSPPSRMVKGALHKVDGHPQHGDSLQDWLHPACNQLPDLQSTCYFTESPEQDAGLHDICSAALQGYQAVRLNEIYSPGKLNFKQRGTPNIRFVGLSPHSNCLSDIERTMLLSERSGSQHRHCKGHSIKALRTHSILGSLNTTVCELCLSVVACCVWRVVARRQEVLPVDKR